MRASAPARTHSSGRWPACPGRRCCGSRLHAVIVETVETICVVARIAFCARLRKGGQRVVAIVAMLCRRYSNDRTDACDRFTEDAREVARRCWCGAVTPPRQLLHRLRFPPACPGGRGRPPAPSYWPGGR